MKQPIFLRLDGNVFDDTRFELRTCWETTYVTKRERTEDGNFAVEVLDAAGESLFSMHPEVGYPIQCEPGRSGPTVARLIAYLPLLDGANEVTVRYRGIEIYRAKIAPTPPKLGNVEVKPESTKATIRWSLATATKESPRHFSLFFIDQKRRPTLLATRVEKPSYVLRFEESRVYGRGRFAVVAHQGLRSASRRSTPVVLPKARPSLTIVEPYRDAYVPFGQPLSVQAVSIDGAAAKKTLPRLAWSLDGRRLKETTSLMALQDLASGDHVLSVGYAGKGGTTGSHEIRFRVAEPSAAVQQYVAAVKTRVSKRPVPPG